MRRGNRYGVLFCPLLTLFFAGCSGGKYMEMFDLPQEGWTPDEAIVFVFSPVAADASKRGGDGEWIDISIRYDDDFPYATLPLEIKGVAPDKRFWSDTIHLSLVAPASGPAHSSGRGDRRRAGRHYTNHYDLTRRYRSGIRYPAGGEYALSIRQLTGDRPLRGIRSFGIVVSGAEPVRQR